MSNPAILPIDAIERQNAATATEQPVSGGLASLLNELKRDFPLGTSDRIDARLFDAAEATETSASKADRTAQETAPRGAHDTRGDETQGGGRADGPDGLQDDAFIGFLPLTPAAETATAAPHPHAAGAQNDATAYLNDLLPAAPTAADPFAPHDPTVEPKPSVGAQMAEFAGSAADNPFELSIAPISGRLVAVVDAARSQLLSDVARARSATPDDLVAEALDWYLDALIAKRSAT